jgi:hypothetical protein
MVLVFLRCRCRVVVVAVSFLRCCCRVVVATLYRRGADVETRRGASLQRNNDNAARLYVQPTYPSNKRIRPPTVSDSTNSVLSPYPRQSNPNQYIKYIKIVCLYYICCSNQKNDKISGKIQD